MRRQAVLFTIAVVALFSVACQRHESNVTGTYGDRVVTGQVVMASEVANHSPAGVEVSVMGTGMAATLAADGRFTFVGVPDNATLAFRRADGIDARMRIGNGSGTLAVEIGPNGAKPSKRRGASPADPGPHQEIEGLVTNVDTTANTLTVHDSHGNDVTVALTDTTLIRKGDKVVKASDLANGDRVHVKAVMVNNKLTATQVIVQDTEDDGNNDQNKVEIEGTVVTAAADSITVHDSHGQDVTAAITKDTVVRKGNTTVDPTTLKKGDRVHVKATKATDGTLTATEIIVQNTESNPGQSKVEIEGTVVTASADSITVHDSHGNDVTAAITKDTVVRKGNTTVDPATLAKDTRVHVKATKNADGTLTATEIIVQDTNDDSNDD